MTSPAQLKYLDAIGIPVWVSRDLVVAESNNKVDGATHFVSADHTNSQTNSSSNSSLAVKGLLDTLSKPAFEKKSHVNINDEVVNSVVQSKITEDIKTHSTAKTSQANTAHNLLKQTEEHYIYACGSITADWMVVGYSPEPFTGIEQEPFGGEAGVLLDNMLRAVNISQPRHEAYMLNIVDINTSPSRSTKNPQSKQALKQHLLSVIEQVKPTILLLVGQNAAQVLLDSVDPLIILRSKTHAVSSQEIPAVVTYYPSYLLSKPSDKRKAWEDLKLAMRLLDTKTQ